MAEGEIEAGKAKRPSSLEPCSIGIALFRPDVVHRNFHVRADGQEHRALLACGFEFRLIGRREFVGQPDVHADLGDAVVDEPPRVLLAPRKDYKEGGGGSII